MKQCTKVETMKLKSKVYGVCSGGRSPAAHVSTVFVTAPVTEWEKQTMLRRVYANAMQIRKRRSMSDETADRHF
jgi:hypothetical protein